MNAPSFPAAAEAAARIIPHSPAPARTPPRALLRFALRDLRGGLGGFGIFIACVALGVAAIVGVGSLSRSLQEGVQREGRTILGGDAAFSLLQREATPAEIAVLEGQGAVSRISTLRAMARLGAGAADERAALVEFKAVDASYPTLGEVALSPPPNAGETLAARLAPREIGGRPAFGAAVDPILLARLDAKLGDVVEIGQARFELRSTVVSEPDKLAVGIGFGPRVLATVEGLAATGLVQPGSLVRNTYRLNLPAGAADDAALARAQAAIAQAAPEAGWEVRARDNASPQFRRNVERFTQFLGLVGLTALLVGGVGVANAVNAFVDRRRPTIATLKSLGATGRAAFLVCLLQVLAIALLGALIGAAVGTALPFAVDAAFGAALPVPLRPSVFPSEVGLGLLYGLLVALAFALLPLGRAHDIPVSALFRDELGGERRWPRAGYLAAAATAALALAGAALLFAWDRRVALAFIGAALGAFVLLRLVAWGLMALAARLPRPKRTEWRLALTNLHRPGALTPSVVLSLGLGVTLLVTLGLVDANLRGELQRGLPGRAPSFFFLDVPNAEVSRFVETLARQAPGAAIDRAPMMRGRIVAVKGVPSEQVRAADRVAWVLDGDRGVTYAAAPPAGSRVTAGEWWPADYRGPPLVSFARDVAEGLGLNVGDEITVNVLGRNVTARVANLREVEWRSLGINFVLVFTPATFAAAPHTHLVTLTQGADVSPDAALRAEGELVRSLARAYPSVTAVRVRDAIEAFNTVVEQLVFAMRGASGIALVASVLVLAGALAAGRRARLYDAVVLKTLGATRGRLAAAYLAEYGLLGLATAVFGALAGALAAWAIVGGLMGLDFAMSWGAVVLSASVAVIFAILFGLVGTLRILSAKPAPYLRDL